MSEPILLHPLTRAARPVARNLTSLVPRFLLLVLPFLAFASYGLFDPELLGYHHYRQAHVAMEARSFASWSANPFTPAIDGVSWGKSLYVNEFPLYAWLVGMLWRLTGESLVVARLLSLAFGLAALWTFRRLMRRLVDDPRIADTATLLLGLMPVATWFFRTVQRQSLFLFLLLLGLERTVAWIDRGGRRRLAAGIVALTGAVLLNPFAVYAGLPLADRFVRRRGAATLFRPAILGAAALVLLPAALWYGRVILIAPTLETEHMVALTAPVTHRNFFELSRYTFWLEPRYWLTMLRTTAQFVLPFVTTFGVFVYGVVRVRHDPDWRFARVWLASVVAYFVMDFYPIAIMVHQYYYLNLAPPAAAFLAAGFLGLYRWVAAAHPGSVDPGSWRFGRRRRLVVAWLTVVVFLAGAVKYTRRLVENDWHREYYGIAAQLTREVPERARVQVLANSDDPLLSWILGERVRHRLGVYTPQALDALLAMPDFDYLAIVHDRMEPPPWPALDRVRRAGLSQVATGPGLHLFRVPPGPVAEAAP